MARAMTDLNPADLLPADPLLHLLRRATYGPTPASIAEIKALGAPAWLERQLAPATIPDAACDALVARLPMAGWSIDTVRAEVARDTIKQYSWDVMYQTGLAATARAVWSERQLYELMVDFWSNHLNVTCPAGEGWDSRQDYDRQVIRRYALGRFADLLKASARHPAMLSYLDNRYSTRAAPNENYGRELLELHTVGLSYTEADVRNAARLLTGLTVDERTGRYRYHPKIHHVGAVAVLNFRHSNRTEAGGEAAALNLLDHLAMHPATARRIATKLCVRFVSDTPPAALVSRLAAVYLAGRTAIVPVLRALFTSPEFAASTGQKSRTPLEDMVATVRILGWQPEQVTADNPAGTRGVSALYWTLDAAGQKPLAWAPPNGYPDVAAAWASPSGYLVRWNAHLAIAAAWYPNTFVRSQSLVDEFVPVRPATYGALIDVVARRLLQRTVHDQHRTAIAGFFGQAPGSPLRAKDAVLKWMFPYLVALLLNSPYFVVR
jgi:uncharacterized protein (DUF1800 family)